jgi:cytochrome c oxidase assembly factor CtaG
VQFCILAIVVPTLLTMGAPWQWIRLAAGLDTAGSDRTAGAVDRLADRRLRHPELIRTLGFVALDVLAVVAWRTPGAAVALVRHGWLAPVEAATVILLGVGLWLELLESPPLVPRSGHLRRAVVAASAMWAFWIDAYVVGLSNTDWYRNFHHVAGHGLSAAADQQIAAAIIWFVAAAAFAPVVFVSALQWIRTDDDPNAELYRLTKLERRSPT